MQTKGLKITPPEGYEIDKENSTFEYIKFKKKPLTYEDVAKELLRDNYCRLTTPIKGTSIKQLEKLLAINKLINVAKYLNGDWKPNWSINECKYFLYCSVNNKIAINYVVWFNSKLIYFKSKELAQQAIDILGEETIRLALSTDW